MGRRRTGWIRKRGGVPYAGFTLRSGKTFETRVPVPPGRGSLSEIELEKFLADLVSKYESGRWDPTAPKAPPVPVSESLTFVEYVRRFASSRTYESAAKDRRRVEQYVAASPISGVPVREVKPAHGADFIRFLVALPSRRGKTLGSSAIRSIYDICQRALDDAIVQELLTINPFRLRPVRAQLPPKRFKDPRARKDGWFRREEVVRLLTDPRIDDDRRVLYAVLFLTGVRPGESAALRFGDWDRDAAPLTCLRVARAVKSVTMVEGPTKTEADKEAPVHPVLHAVLEQWFAEGWARHMGRAPTPDDYLIPSVRGRRKGRPRNGSTLNRRFRNDCETIGLRSRRVYCARHTFITLTKSDGGDPQLLKLITHAPPSSAYEGYVRENWGPLCAALSKLQIALPTSAEAAKASTPAEAPTPSAADTLVDTLESTVALAENPSKQGVSGGSTEESNLPRGAKGTVATSFEDWARHQTRSYFHPTP